MISNEQQVIGQGRPDGNPHNPNGPNNPGPPDHAPGPPDGLPPGPPDTVPPVRPDKTKKPFGGDGPSGPSSSRNMWWRRFSGRWLEEVDLMRYWFPQFSWERRRVNDSVLPVWTGWIRPWPSTIREAAAVYSILKRGGEVGRQMGTVLPLHQPVASNLTIPQFLTDTVIAEQYLIEVIHRNPPAHPKAFLITPIPQKATPHRYADGSICPLTPHGNEWSWETHRLVHYLDAVGEWLAKYSVFVQTQRWIGPASSHAPKALQAIESDAQCFCGSGLPFASCHKRLAK